MIKYLLVILLEYKGKNRTIETLKEGIPIGIFKPGKDGQERPTGGSTGPSGRATR